MATSQDYAVSMAKGAGVGLLFGGVLCSLKYFNVWRSPEGGRIICVDANLVEPWPFHFDAGLTVAFFADVPSNYTCTGPWIGRHLIPPPIALGGGLAIGALLGAVKAHSKASQK